MSVDIETVTNTGGLMEGKDVVGGNKPAIILALRECFRNMVTFKGDKMIAMCFSHNSKLHILVSTNAEPFDSLDHLLDAGVTPFRSELKEGSVKGDGIKAAAYNLSRSGRELVIVGSRTKASGFAVAQGHCTEEGEWKSSDVTRQWGPILFSLFVDQSDEEHSKDPKLNGMENFESMNVFTIFPTDIHESSKSPLTNEIISAFSYMIGDAVEDEMDDNFKLTYYGDGMVFQRDPEKSLNTKNRVEAIASIGSFPRDHTRYLSPIRKFRDQFCHKTITIPATDVSFEHTKRDRSYSINLSAELTIDFYPGFHPSTKEQHRAGRITSLNGASYAGTNNSPPEYSVYLSAPALREFCPEKRSVRLKHDALFFQKDAGSLFAYLGQGRLPSITGKEVFSDNAEFIEAYPEDIPDGDRIALKFEKRTPFIVMTYSITNIKSITVDNHNIGSKKEKKGVDRVASAVGGTLHDVFIFGDNILCKKLCEAITEKCSGLLPEEIVEYAKKFFPIELDECIPFPQTEEEIKALKLKKKKADFFFVDEEGKKIKSLAPGSNTIVSLVDSNSGPVIFQKDWLISARSKGIKAVPIANGELVALSISPIKDIVTGNPVLLEDYSPTSCIPSRTVSVRSVDITKPVIEIEGLKTNPQQVKTPTREDIVIKPRKKGKDGEIISDSVLNGSFPRQGEGKNYFIECDSSIAGYLGPMGLLLNKNYSKLDFVKLFIKSASVYTRASKGFKALQSLLVKMKTEAENSRFISEALIIKGFNAPHMAELYEEDSRRFVENAAIEFVLREENVLATTTRTLKFIDKLNSLSEEEAADQENINRITRISEMETQEELAAEEGR